MNYFKLVLLFVTFLVFIPYGLIGETISTDLTNVDVNEVPLVKGSDAVYTIDAEQQEEGEEFDTKGPILWNSDILVFGGRTGSGQDFDYDPSTGAIYAIFDTDHSTYDTVYVYKSEDGGLTWQNFRVSYSSSGELNKPKIRVARDQAGSLQVNAMLINVFSDGTQYLYLRRLRENGTPSFSLVLKQSQNHQLLQVRMGLLW